MFVGNVLLTFVPGSQNSFAKSAVPEPVRLRGMVGPTCIAGKCTGSPAILFFSQAVGALCPPLLPEVRRTFVLHPVLFARALCQTECTLERLWCSQGNSVNGQLQMVSFIVGKGAIGKGCVGLCRRGVRRCRSCPGVFALGQRLWFGTGMP